MLNIFQGCSQPLAKPTSLEAIRVLAGQDLRPTSHFQTTGLHEYQSTRAFTQARQHMKALTENNAKYGNSIGLEPIAGGTQALLCHILLFSNSGY
ncbi:hypothetical protein [Sulfuriflexus mobilis]|uniref:hypothetical protein n=1 Tax=Sulfuriflexus mobilis TaxID=1811807 RepID=UPI000F84B3EC|nr:hypothetical protein [Sulfuriflexus mobilis]